MPPLRSLPGWPLMGSASALVRDRHQEQQERGAVHAALFPTRNHADVHYPTATVTPIDQKPPRGRAISIAMFAATSLCSEPFPASTPWYREARSLLEHAIRRHGGRPAWQNAGSYSRPRRWGSAPVREGAGKTFPLPGRGVRPPGGAPGSPLTAAG